MTPAENAQIFLKGLETFFTKLGQEPEIGIPHPRESDFRLMDYTGAIGLSGLSRGCIYVTSGSALLDAISSAYNVPASEEVRLDTIGELANTIAGNAQDNTTSTFEISVPMVITGSPDNILLPMRTPVFIVPFSWKGQKGFLGIGVNQG
jgi:chemotaxis protein CheX